jgi:tetratricopeptide (TPR) repeat protein
MNKLTFVFLMGLVFFSACKSDSKNGEDVNEFDERIELSQLDSIRAELQRAMPNVPINSYKKAIAMHLQFVEYNAEDAFAPVALDYAQGYAEQIQDLRTSISIINRILAEYPDYKGKQMLMYNKATHHDFLRDVEEAIAAYEAYLKEFPNLSKTEKAEIQDLIRLAPYTLEERIKMQSEQAN